MVDIGIREHDVQLYSQRDVLDDEKGTYLFQRFPFGLGEVKVDNGENQEDVKCGKEHVCSPSDVLEHRSRDHDLLYLALQYDHFVFSLTTKKFQSQLEAVERPFAG
jgi:hypothetical protein